MNKTIQQIIAMQKDDQAFGGLSALEVENGRRALLQTLGEMEMTRPVYGFRTFLSFVAAYLSDVIARPLAVGFSSVVLALGAWVVVVNASSESVPGDTLYPVKIATEKMQLTLTTSQSQRAKLHVEFAERRLTEVTVIRGSDRSGKNVRVQSALQGFRQEMAYANSQLASLSKDHASSTSEVATLIDKKTSEFKGTIRDSAVDPDTSQEEVRAAQEETVSTGQTATRALVEAQELLPENTSNGNLQNVFGRNMEEIKGRIAVIRHRLGPIETVLNQRELPDDLVFTSRSVITKIRERLIEIQPSITEAETVLAAGGYRRTFEILADLQNTMTVTDDLLAQLEITITTATQTLQKE